MQAHKTIFLKCLKLTLFLCLSLSSSLPSHETSEMFYYYTCITRICSKPHKQLKCASLYKIAYRFGSFPSSSFSISFTSLYFSTSFFARFLCVVLRFLSESSNIARNSLEANSKRASWTVFVVQFAFSVHSCSASFYTVQFIVQTLICSKTR